MILHLWFTIFSGASCVLAIPLFPVPLDIRTLWNLFGHNHIPQARIYDSAGWCDPRIGGGQMLDVCFNLMPFDPDVLKSAAVHPRRLRRTTKRYYFWKLGSVHSH
jgi:hypothetical protein